MDTTVAFLEVPKSYCFDSDVACVIKVPKSYLSASEKAFVSISPVGWQQPTEYHAFVWLNNSAQSCDDTRVVVFPASQLPTDSAQYQFVFVNGAGDVRASSQPFVFADAASSDSLLSFELIDESRTSSMVPVVKEEGQGTMGKGGFGGDSPEESEVEECPSSTCVKPSDLSASGTFAGDVSSPVSAAPKVEGESSDAIARVECNGESARMASVEKAEKETENGLLDGDDEEREEDDDEMSSSSSSSSSSDDDDSMDDEDDPIDDEEDPIVIIMKPTWVTPGHTTTTVDRQNGDLDKKSGKDGQLDDEREKEAEENAEGIKQPTYCQLAEENETRKEQITYLAGRCTKVENQMKTLLDGISNGDTTARVKQLWKEERFACEKMEVKVSEYKQEMREAKEQQQLFQEENAHLHQLVQFLKQGLEEKDALVEELSKQLAGEKENSESLTCELSEAKEDLEEVKSDLNQKKEQCTELCHVVGQLEGRCATLDEKLHLKRVHTKLLLKDGSLISDVQRDPSSSLSLDLQNVLISTPPSYQSPGGDLSIGEFPIEEVPLKAAKKEKRHRKTKCSSEDVTGSSTPEKKRRHRSHHRHHHHLSSEERRKLKIHKAISDALVEATKPSAPPMADVEEVPPSACPVCDKPYPDELDAAARRQHCESHFEKC
eukprot:m.306828 g.306828  ORF g.306828 m.306828 type:complete len:661 (+) comp41615_c0_seq1:36-2018(+)